MRVAIRLVLAGAVLAGTATLTAQDPASAEGRLKASFRQFDANESGWLSGRELTACGCRAFDADANGEVTWDEFRIGSGKGTPAPTATWGAATTRPEPRTAPARTAATPAQAQNRPAAPTPAQTRPPARNGTYAIPDRVEVNYGGTWYKGTIYGEKDGTYKVMRDDYTSDDRWVTPADLRRLVEAPREDPAMANAPRSVPTGSYHCTTIVAGFGASSSMTSTIGSLRILGPATYTALSKQGPGPRASYTYDPRSGRIEWEGGQLKGFFGLVESSSLYGRQSGPPGIGIVYRVRAGGNRFNLNCDPD